MQLFGFPSMGTCCSAVGQNAITGNGNSRIFVTEILVTFIHADAVTTFVKENLSQKTCSEFMKFSSNYMRGH